MQARQAPIYARPGNRSRRVDLSKLACSLAQRSYSPLCGPTFLSKMLLYVLFQSLPTSCTLKHTYTCLFIYLYLFLYLCINLSTLLDLFTGACNHISSNIFTMCLILPRFSDTLKFFRNSIERRYENCIRIIRSKVSSSRKLIVALLPKLNRKISSN